jgi:hypothetical protein
MNQLIAQLPSRALDGIAGGMTVTKVTDMSSRSLMVSDPSPQKPTALTSVDTFQFVSAFA